MIGMKNRNLSILKAFIFVMMAVCFFSNGTLKASAASEVKGLTQTRSEEDSVTVSWKSLKNAYGYDVFISSGNGKYKRLTNKTCDVVGSKNTKKKISNLTSSRTYYVVVKAVYKKENGKYSIIKNYTTSELQELGFTNSQINSMKKISIYDELMINPDLSKVE